jgi:hypothetical protein
MHPKPISAVFVKGINIFRFSDAAPADRGGGRL